MTVKRGWAKASNLTHAEVPTFHLQFEFKIEFLSFLCEFKQNFYFKDEISSVKTKFRVLKRNFESSLSLNAKYYGS